MRGKPNEEKKKNIINYIFSFFNNCDGVIDDNQMKQVFSCHRHPKFTMGN